MNTVRNHTRIVNILSGCYDTFLRFASGFLIGAALCLLGIWMAGCGTLRGAAHDISVITATMAQDPHPQADPGQ